MSREQNALLREHVLSVTITSFHNIQEDVA